MRTPETNAWQGIVFVIREENGTVAGIELGGDFNLSLIGATLYQAVYVEITSGNSNIPESENSRIVLVDRCFEPRDFRCILVRLR